MILNQKMQSVVKATENMRVRVTITNSSRVMRYVIIDIGFEGNRVVSQKHLKGFSMGEMETVLAPDMEIRMRQRHGKDVHVEWRTL